MSKLMLIDATHAEETRVALLDGNRLEDFDVETKTRRQLKGNIYLAKVVRVEPSLQAAFVEYGGNRHGFLAFGEIHPDYYQIPVADRQRLLEMQEAEARAEAEEEEEEGDLAAGSQFGGHGAHDYGADAPEGGDYGANAPEDGGEIDLRHAFDAEFEPMGGLEIDGEIARENARQNAEDDADARAEGGQGEAEAAQDANDADGRGRSQGLEIAQADQDMRHGEDVLGHEEGAAEAASTAASGDDLAELGDRVQEIPAEMHPPPETVGGNSENGDDHGVRERRAPPRFLRNYKIQEVIRRRQIMLIQVVKEERGTKGAALTTYISLAGRYSVLMPNSPRGGGISRKITSAADRRRLKEITAELEIPRGMGLIVRTAGANRPKPEIKRDCEYLLRMWDEIRDLTLRSVAPALIYEEASLIKRAIRDVYSREVDEIVVDGEDGWKAARDFMRLIMPTHVKKVQMWRPDGPKLFARYGVEAQIDGMLNPTVQLRSGGYLVINQTEALVAIDVNSGRSTRERGIEETALRTNLEAAEEVARQLRLRDLAGLIVIDFIDMESKKHNAAVERRLKESLKNDRARIQVGHISHFGLMEMSRQRLRPPISESSMDVCPHCAGLGRVRSTESAALAVIRALEEEGAKRRAAEVLVHVNAATALYILNNKRELLAATEQRFGMKIRFAAEDGVLPEHCQIERLRAPSPAEIAAPITAERIAEPMLTREAEDGDDVLEDEADETSASAEGGEGSEEERRRRRRRRRRGRGPRNADGSEATQFAEGEQPEVSEAAFPVLMREPPAPRPAREDDGSEAESEEGAAAAGGENAEGQRRRRRRRRGRDRFGRNGEGKAEGDADGAPEALQAGAEDGDEGMEDAPRAPLPTRSEPARGYQGPTPADPFADGGMDIFDILEAAEQRDAVPARSPARAEPAPSLLDADDDFDPLIDPTPPARSEPPAAAKPAAAAAETPAAAAPAPQAEAPAEPVVGPAIEPVRVEDAAVPAKRGWWRR